MKIRIKGNSIFKKTSLNKSTDYKQYILIKPTYTCFIK